MKEQITIDLSDIYDIWLPAWWQSPWSWLYIFLAICSLSVFIGMFYRMMKNRKNRKKTAYDLLLDQLKSLENIQQRLTHEQQKEFYLELTYIIKILCKKHLNFDVEHLTDYELIDFLKINQSPDEIISVVMSLIEHGYHIKFARESAIHDQMFDDLQKVVVLVRNASTESLLKK